MTTVPFAAWEPDKSDLNATLLGDVLNVLPAGNSWISTPSLSLFTQALGSEPLGAIRAIDSDGQTNIFVGLATTLVKLNPNTLAWDNVSQTSVTYAASSLTPWDFAQFGDYVIAVNANNAPQVFQLNSSSEFDDLAGSPPRGHYVRVWGDFLAIMCLTSAPNTVQWSALNNIEGWTVGTDNSDFQEFPDGGRIQGSTNTTNPIIIQERAVRLGTFIPGSVQVFSFQKIHDQRGAKSPRSIASRGEFTFFADEGGFFQIGPDGSIAPIGFEKVDRTVFGSLASTDISQIVGVVDAFYSRVYWAVDYSGSGRFDRLIVYDWNLQRWTQIDVDISLHITMATLGQTLEGLDALYASVDAMTISLDSKVWQGGAPVLAAFNADRRLCFFSGPALEATLTTQEMGDVAGGVTRVTSVYPITDAAGVGVSIGSRFRRQDAPVWTAEQIASSNTGRVRKIARARFHRFKLRIPDATVWSHAQGVDVDSKPAGYR